MDLDGWNDEMEARFIALNPHASAGAHVFSGGCFEDLPEEQVDLTIVKEEPSAEDDEDEGVAIQDLLPQPSASTSAQLHSRPSTGAGETCAATLPDTLGALATQPALDKPCDASLPNSPVPAASRVQSIGGPRLQAVPSVPKPARSCQDQDQVDHDRGTSVARSLADGLNFTEYYMKKLEAIPADALPGDYDSAIELIADRMDQGEADGTSFSGVEAPMCARKMLHRAVEQRLERKVCEPKVLHVVEWDSSCQAELLALDDDACVFGDICGFFREEVAPLVAGLRKNPALAMETLAPLLEQKKLVKRSAYCLRHAQLDCKAVTCDMSTLWVCGWCCRTYASNSRVSCVNCMADH